ncbi:MAG: 4-(cytidine 5'-diphospho)-2-C-methyl-D-erythritol kinase [Alphaproteobacteria bacterium]
MSAGLALHAPAKVNLFLHVLCRRADGYHDLESLIVFVDVGDRLTVSPARDLSLTIGGPFAPLLAHEPVADNLVFRAGTMLRDKAGVSAGARVVLEKHLPIAAGLGGGSADAAAALRLLTAHWTADLPRDDLHALGLALGADIPVCIESRPAFAAGVGEILTETPRLPDLWAVLVNSGTPVPTGKVFKGLDPDALAGVCGPTVPPEAFNDAQSFVEALKATRNDLEPPALRVAPDIADVLDVIAAQPGCRLARMSGSGGTCFGLFAAEAEAQTAARAILDQRPAWWARPGALLQAAPNLVADPAVQPA